ncbi:hypothetical protein CAI16_02880 [Virgibacillus dokdonensis]|uniref:YqzN/YkzM domain-containing protein n=1 Tax=Virgibacillus dokdonensis TaxID=302167 RepID=A0A3E0WVM8_9BACI|nr:hypothetical protein [Virgibacillus dokdonensis]RFA37034.1 hypothetical protein CAI16_02880 [Virgibacillus dokdonensis]
MSAAKQQQNKQAEVKKETSASVTSTAYKEPEFSLTELRKHSRKLFGVKPEVFDGAFFNTKKTHQQNEKRRS